MLTPLLGLLLASQVPTFSSGVDLVRLDVSVTRDGRPVAGLGPADFEVRDEGALQEVQAASRGEEPLHAVLALDTSGSVEGARLERLKSAAMTFVGNLRPGDCAQLVTFSSTLRLFGTACLEPSAIGAAIMSTAGSGATRLHEGLFAALILADTRRGLPVVVAFTDGVDTLSWLGTNAPLLAAKTLPATLHVVAVADPPGLRFGTGGRRSIHPGPVVVAGGTPPFLGQIAAETGGRVFPADAGDLEAAFGRVLEEIRGRYLLCYEPRGVPHAGWHRLQVKLKGRRGEVRTRRGYVARPR